MSPRNPMINEEYDLRDCRTRFPIKLLHQIGASARSFTYNGCNPSVIQTNGENIL